MQSKIILLSFEAGTEVAGVIFGGIIVGKIELLHLFLHIVEVLSISFGNA